VFLKPLPIRFGEEGAVIGNDELAGKSIGVLGEYAPYREYAASTQTRRPRVVFEENTGLSRVWSVGFIQDLATSDSARQQIDRLREEEERSS
jgi:hypothetical protein